MASRETKAPCSPLLTSSTHLGKERTLLAHPAGSSLKPRSKKAREMQGLINSGPRQPGQGVRVVRLGAGVQGGSGVQDVAANKFKEREPRANMRAGPRLGVPVSKLQLWLARRRGRASSGPAARCGHWAKLSCKVTGRYEGPWDPPFSGFPGLKRLACPSWQRRGSFLCLRGSGGPRSELSPVLSYPRSGEGFGLGLRTPGFCETVPEQAGSSGPGSRRGFSVRDL